MSVLGSRKLRRPRAMNRTVKLRTRQGNKVRIVLDNWASGLDHTFRRWTRGDDYWECMDTGELAEESGLSGLKIFVLGTPWFSYHMRRQQMALTKWRLRACAARPWWSTPSSSLRSLSSPGAPTTS